MTLESPGVTPHVIVSATLFSAAALIPFLKHGGIMKGKKPIGKITSFYFIGCFQCMPIFLIGKVLCDLPFQ